MKHMSKIYVELEKNPYDLVCILNIKPLKSWPFFEDGKYSTCIPSTW
jgi:hypothetical protein